MHNTMKSVLCYSILCGALLLGASSSHATTNEGAPMVIAQAGAGLSGGGTAASGNGGSAYDSDEAGASRSETYDTPSNPLNTTTTGTKRGKHNKKTHAPAPHTTDAPTGTPYSAPAH